MLVLAGAQAAGHVPAHGTAGAGQIADYGLLHEANARGDFGRGTHADIQHSSLALPLSLPLLTCSAAVALFVPVVFQGEGAAPKISFDRRRFGDDSDSDVDLDGL